MLTSQPLAAPAPGLFHAPPLTLASRLQVDGLIITERPHNELDEKTPLPTLTMAIQASCSVRVVFVGRVQLAGRGACPLLSPNWAMCTCSRSRFSLRALRARYVIVAS